MYTKRTNFDKGIEHAKFATSTISITKTTCRIFLKTFNCVPPALSVT